MCISEVWPWSSIVEFLNENSVSLVHQTWIKGTGDVIKFFWTGYDLKHCSCEPWTTCHIWISFKCMNCQKKSDMTKIDKNIFKYLNTLISLHNLLRQISLTSLFHTSVLRNDGQGDKQVSRTSRLWYKNGFRLMQMKCVPSLCDERLTDLCTRPVFPRHRYQCSSAVNRVA